MGNHGLASFAGEHQGLGRYPVGGNTNDGELVTFMP